MEFNATFPPRGSKEEAFSEGYYTEVQRDAFAPQIEDYRKDPSFRLYEKGLVLAESLTGGRALLDVGAGVGAFMRGAADRGWSVSGVELSAYGARVIREKYRFDVRRGDFACVDLGSARFDLVTFWDSLEHVEKPAECLARAFALLNPGGIVLVCTDNYNSLMASAARALYAAAGWTYPVRKLFTAYNRSYFTDDVLTRMLRGTGFEVVRSWRMDYPLARLPLTIVEKAVVGLLYLVARVVSRQAEITIMARKPLGC